MIRKSLLVLLALLVSAASFAVGTITLSSRGVGAGLTKYTVLWLSDASGDVSGNTRAMDIKRGYIRQVEFIPDGGGTAPDDNYDATLVDEAGVDFLQAQGADLGQSTSTLILFDPPIYHDAVGRLDLVIANAGNANGGTVHIWIGD